MNTRRNRLLLIGITLSVLALAYAQSPTAQAHRMYRFSSLGDLQSFLKDKSLNCGTRDYFLGGAVPAGPNVLTMSNARASEGSSSVPSHSETNNQVQGVDELDSVKSDGNYIYTASDGKLVIVKAYPASDASVVSTISVNGTIIGEFANGDKLAIFGQATQYYGPQSMGIALWDRPVFLGSNELSVWVYDIADRSKPVLKTTLSVDGSFIGARMIGDFVYLVASQSIPYCGTDVQLPRLLSNQRMTAMVATQVFHSDISDYGHTFTNVLAFDITHDGEEPAFKSFLLGSSGTIYVSLRDLYLTAPTWGEEQVTVIHRIKLDQKAISYEATGQVPGQILNQFSMDEYGDYFRVATQAWRSEVVATSGTTVSTTTSTAPSVVRASSLSGQSSNVYVLNRNLNIVGRVEGLGQDENFHSARFMGDRAYLVTFKKTDPLFVIDLSEPENPRVLGELQISGYSDYLQPYDETHLIGIGKEAEDMGYFAWYMGVKVALFDVSDPANPKQIGNFTIGDRGTDSVALRDHKAVLFDHDRNLLVIPVNVNEYLNGGAPPAWGTPVFQGAYVFTASPGYGVVFRGGITHLAKGEDPGYGNQTHWVSRSLFIEDVLYTISPSQVKLNNLTDLSEIKALNF